MAEPAGRLLARPRGQGPAPERSARRHEALDRRAAGQAAAGYSALLSARPAGPQPFQRAGRTGLPDSLRTGIEALSGLSMDGVKVHRNSPRPAQLGANAYAQGRDIHLAPGQDRHLPHEAWHVVQQAQGRVRPTMQMMGGVAVNDDAGLEREADVMGERAARAKAAISGPKSIERGLRLVDDLQFPPLHQAQCKVVQRGGDQSKADDEAVMQGDYKKHVEEAVGLLKGKIGFGASPDGKYDKKYWKVIDDKTYKKAIEATVLPSVAIKALIAADADVWDFDCAEYLQVCNLYAAMKLYGKEYVDKKKPLILRQHGSTTFEGAGATFERKTKGSKFDIIFHKKDNAFAPDFINEDTLLKNVPVGSRVCFKNPAGTGTPFGNENAIVLGGGTYSAHPMGSGITAETILSKLVEYNKRTSLGGDDGGAGEMFVSQAEIYSSIPMGMETRKALGIATLGEYL